MKAKLILGKIYMASGVLLIAVYIWTAIIMPWGNPDQSLLFWLSFLPLIAIRLIYSALNYFA
jgi:hypothetical protein